MSIPFSNTTLRVPRGFGNLLEGLAREVLRSQPKDIPTFAALYFGALLKEREESGLDPAEWGAKLEDRFYNNHAFQPEKEKEADGSSEPQQEAVGTIHESSVAGTPSYIEDEFIQPVHLATVASANFNVFDDDVPRVESCRPPSEIVHESSVAGTPSYIEDEVIQPVHLATVASANFNVFDDDVPRVESCGPASIGSKPEEVDGSPEPLQEPVGTVHESSVAGTPSYIEDEVIQPVHLATVASANFNVFDDDVPRVESCGPASIGSKASEDICNAELDPSPVAPYGGLQVPGGMGNFDLTTAMVTPSPLPTPLGVPEDIPASATPGSLLLDFGDEEVEQMPEATPGYAAEEPALMVSMAEPVRGEAPGRPEVVVEHGEGQEELQSKGGDTSRSEPQTGGEETSHFDPHVQAKEDDPSFGKALGSAKEEDPPLRTALDLARHEGSTGESNVPESIHSQKTCTEECFAMAEATNRETPPQNSESLSDDKACDVEIDGKQEMKMEAIVADAESDEIRGGDQDISKEEVRITAEEEDTKESVESGQDIGSEEQEEGKELEKQIRESEDLNQDAESEEQEQGKESEVQEQGTESEEQVKELEDLHQGVQSEEQSHGAELEEQEQGKESEVQEQGTEEQEQIKESEDLNQGAQSEEQKQGAELEGQVPAVIPEVSVDEREPKVEGNDSDKQEPEQQEEETVLPLGEDGSHKFH
ncbi:high mobility group nucleosome-binding domain-containing protein 5-like [Conger conger]|uniref:high mobility group nucleosome-binding domain-containing protein 5-like n=1 Tax=Conger conger TaxID=82655 RepID=UPI002A59858D|nr:high mobility group nucleosome-binding domain-containing protein 5-like [Conger conger]